MENRDYVEIKKENIEEIKDELEKGNGRILISELSSHCFFRENGQLSFYDRPFLNIDNSDSENLDVGLYVKRSGKTDYEKDRQYYLKPIPESADNEADYTDSLRSQFDKLRIGSYEFKIGPQLVVGRDLFREEGLVLYIPRSNSLEGAFYYGVKHVVDLINQSSKEMDVGDVIIQERYIHEVVKYTLDDLKDGKVLKHNVQAGINADSFFEI